MNKTKGSLIALTASSLLVGSLSFVVVAQTQSDGASGAAQSETQQNEPVARRFGGFERDAGRYHGFGGLPFGRLALGTTAEVTFYDGDPETGGSSLETLTLTYGEDSEASFAQAFATAQENAAYLVVNIGEQTQTLELPSDTSDTSFGRGDRHDGVYGALPLRGLNKGSSVTATFYDGDPAADGQSLQALTLYLRAR